MYLFTCLWLAFAILLVGSFLCLISRRHEVTGPLALVAMAAAGLLTVFVSVEVFLNGPVTVSIDQLAIAGFPAVPVFTIDRLSALFLGMIGALSTASVLYTQGYLPHIKKEDPRRYYFPFLLFILGMMAVVTVADLFYFLVFWEFMTLTSYFLVVYQRDNKKNLEAGFLYFFVTHVTSAGLILVVILFGGWSGSMAFTAMPEVYRQLAKRDHRLTGGLLCHQGRYLSLRLLVPRSSPGGSRRHQRHALRGYEQGCGLRAFKAYLLDASSLRYDHKLGTGYRHRRCGLNDCGQLKDFE